MIPHTAALLLACTSLCSCFFPDYRRIEVAPGIDDIEEPPSKPELEALEVPEDPGEHILRLSGGVSPAAGWHRAQGAEGSESQWVFVAETSIGYGQKLDQLDCTPPIARYPSWLIDLNLAVTIGEGHVPSTGTMSAELHGRFGPFGLGAGYAYNPALALGGPQFTALVSPLFVRVRHLQDHSVDVVIGVFIGYSVMLAWSK